MLFAWACPKITFQALPSKWETKRRRTIQRASRWWKRFTTCVKTCRGKAHIRYNLSNYFDIYLQNVTSLCVWFRTQMRSVRHHLANLSDILRELSFLMPRLSELLFSLLGVDPFVSLFRTLTRSNILTKLIKAFQQMPCQELVSEE